MSLALPADKSIAHRALLLAALSERASVIDDAGAAADVRSTLGCLRALGTFIEERGSSLSVRGARPRGDDVVVLDAGNSGTSARLLAGWLAGQGRRAVIVGDASLCQRPMARVARPVNALFSGPSIAVSADGTLPLEVVPVPFRESPQLVVETGVPSAQVKSAVLLAALGRRSGSVVVREPAPSRDHTERMLAALGVSVHKDGCAVRLSSPSVPVGGWHLRVPRDPSAVALLATAALGRRRALVVDDVGLNETRTAFLDVLRRMGAHAVVEPRALRLGEPVGRIVIEPPRSALAPVEVSASEAALVIDEIPALAALAALASGVSRFEGVGELRVKESDRLAGLVSGLRAFGATAKAEGDTLVVVGARRLHAAPLEARRDHRLEMALLALAAAADLDVTLSGPSCAHVSFPGFAEALRAVL